MLLATQIAAAPLSDGRVQFWAVEAGTGKIWSTWQDDFDWVYWQDKWTPHLAPFAASDISVAPFSDTRLQFWAVDTSGGLWSCCKITTDSKPAIPSVLPTSAWTQWEQWDELPASFTPQQFTVGRLSDTHLQVWAVDKIGKLWSCQLTTSAPSFSGTAWSPFPSPFTATQIVVAPLSDGRLLLWAIDANGKIWNCMDNSVGSATSWGVWGQFISDFFDAAQIAVAPLSDGRLQLWAIDTAGKLWSCQQLPGSSSVAWTDWRQDWNLSSVNVPTRPTLEVPSKFAAITVVPLANRRLKLWVADSSGWLWTCAQASADPNATWMYWSLAFSMIHQRMSEWCWAACATAISHFYDPNSLWQQCKVVNAGFAEELNGVDCCQPGVAASHQWCNSPSGGSLDNALLNIVGHLAKETTGSVPQSTVTAQAEAGQPLGVGIDWKGGGGHFVVLVGGGPNDMITVKDPIYGTSYMDYAAFSTNYQGQGVWASSYFTE